MISTANSACEDTSNLICIELIIKVMNYTVISQSADDVQDIRNAPSLSMGPFLLATEQTRRLNKLSIYSLRGNSREQLRLLYMNATALEIWRAMGMTPTVIGSTHRPPKIALLTFGVPFSE